MTLKELRQQTGYIEAYNKIINYHSGFEFTVDYSRIPTAKLRALEVVLLDAQKDGLIESIALMLNFDGTTGERFKRL